MKPTYQLLPPLREDEYAALRDDIEANGVQVPIVVDEDGAILDGHHRSAICAELDIPCPSVKQEGLSTFEKRNLALRLNLRRRHLTSEQKRQVLEELIKADPEMSNRRAADAAGVDHKTAGSVRSELEGRGEIPHVKNLTDSKGRSQPAAKPKKDKDPASTSSGERSGHRPVIYDQATGEQVESKPADEGDSKPAKSKDSDYLLKALKRFDHVLFLAQFDAGRVRQRCTPSQLDRFADGQRRINEWFDELLKQDSHLSLVEDA
ncbi:MAG: ParB N-terminal domain-containing protein [Candidatus Nanopelagicales bacterium]